jgi:hypothetical protein
MFQCALCHAYHCQRTVPHPAFYLCTTFLQGVNASRQRVEGPAASLNLIHTLPRGGKRVFAYLKPSVLVRSVCSDFKRLEAASDDTTTVKTTSVNDMAARSETVNWWRYRPPSNAISLLPALMKACASTGNVQSLDDMYLTMSNQIRATLLQWSEICIPAAQTGHLEVLEWAYSHHDSFNTPWLHYSDPNACEPFWFESSSMVLDMAAANGHLHILKWARSVGFKLESSICYHAAKSGHLDVLLWLAAHDIIPRISNSVCNEFVEQGNLDKLMYTRAAGYLCGSSTCSRAAECGQMEILQWLRSTNCPWSLTTCAGAASGGHLEILQWARTNGCHWDEMTCAGSARWGHLHILQWARENGCEWDDHTCSYAARAGHLHVLKWAWENGCPMTESTSSRAAEGGHLELLKWAVDKGCPVIHHDLVFNAVVQGHLDIVIWAHEHTGMSPNLVLWAAESGHLHIIKWALTNGYEWEQEFAESATTFGHLEILKWALDEGLLVLTPELCSSAACRGHLEIIQWLRSNGCPWDARTCFSAVVDHGHSGVRDNHINVLRWAHEQGCPWDEETIRLALDFERQDMVNYARANGCPEDVVD